MKEFTRRVATVVIREHRINLIRRSWLKHERIRRFTCSYMDILSSKYGPRLRSDDDTFTKPSGRTKADLSIMCVQRCEAHHMNSDLDGFNMSRLLDIHSPIDSMHVKTDQWVEIFPLRTSFQFTVQQFCNELSTILWYSFIKAKIS